MQAFANGVTRRPETDADTPFLLSLYASTRADELAQVSWPDAEKRAFVDMQFRAQRHHYRAVFPDARFDVLEHEGAAVGRLYTDERDDELRVIDIIIAPAWRGRSIGSAVLAELIDGAAAAGRIVTIHVERFNPARRLYERLGFVPVEEGPIYTRMERRPPGGQPKITS
jgi:RimJ/RimL family protein N-acetyltransferase